MAFARTIALTLIIIAVCAAGSRKRHTLMTGMMIGFLIAWIPTTIAYVFAR